MFFEVLGSLDVWNEVFLLKNDLVSVGLQSAFVRFLPASASNTISRLVAGSLVKPLSSNNLIFKVTGTQHILALSGFHVSVVVNSCKKLYTSFLNKKLQLIVNCCIVFFYFFIVGFSYSLLRAVCMYVISLFFAFFGRQKHHFILLFYTIVIVILIDVSILNEISFQLSFTATAAIFLFSSMQKESTLLHFFAGVDSSHNDVSSITSYNKIRLYTGKIFFMSLFIQLFLLPLLSHYFGVVSLLSPIVSLFISWVFPITVPIGVLIFFLNFFISPIFLFPLYVFLFVLTSFVLITLKSFNFPTFLISVPQIPLAYCFVIYFLIALIYSLKSLIGKVINERFHKNMYRFDTICHSTFSNS